MMNVWNTLVFVLLLFCEESISLRNVILDIEPKVVQRGGYSTLSCSYDLGESQLYTVKWYRGQHEFYRYTPSEHPSTKTFPFKGVNVDIDLELSNEHQVVLRNVNFQLSGKFSCEVTTETPIQTVTADTNMTVVVLPDEPPTLSTDKSFYVVGDILKVNCTSSPARPAATLSFLMNNLVGITLVDINPKGNEIAEELNVGYGDDKVLFACVDVSNKGDLKDAFQKTVEMFDNIDIVFNNAGVFNETDPEIFYKVNIVGATNCLKLALEEFLPNYKSCSEGVVVNTISTVALNPGHWFIFPYYTASKCAILALTQCFSREFYYKKTGVKVIALCPGPTATPMFAAFDGLDNNEENDKLMDGTSLQKVDDLVKHIIPILKEGGNGSVWKLENKEMEEVCERCETRKHPVDDLFWSEISLQLPLFPSHFLEGRLVLRCVATISDIYQRHTERRLDNAKDPIPERVTFPHSSSARYRSPKTLFLAIVLLSTIYR